MTTRRQYQQALTNRRPRAAYQIVGDGLAARLLRQAATAARRNDRAETAWQQICPPNWLDRTVPAGVADGVLTIVVDSPTLAGQLRGQRARLERALQSHATGIRRLTVKTAGELAVEEADE